MNDTSSRSHSLFTIYVETAETVSSKTCLEKMETTTINLFLFHDSVRFRFKGSNVLKLVSSTWWTWLAQSAKVRPKQLELD